LITLGALYNNIQMIIIHKKPPAENNKNTSYNQALHLKPIKIYLIPHTTIQQDILFPIIINTK